MARPLRRAAAILLAAGTVLALGGLAVAWIGLVRPELISDQIPPGFIDTPAVGGATFALGVGLVLLGFAHVASAAALNRPMRGAATIGVVLGATMGVLAFLFAIAAIVSAASGSASPGLMLPAAAVLLAATAAYAAATVWMLGAAVPATEE